MQFQQRFIGPSQSRGVSASTIALVEQVQCREAARERLRELTERELVVLECMARGLSNNGISDRMHLSTKTVETHVGAIFTKLNMYPFHGENRRVLAVLLWLAAS